jgi:hypothetical protein
MNQMRGKKGESSEVIIKLINVVDFILLVANTMITPQFSTEVQNIFSFSLEE